MPDKYTKIKAVFARLSPSFLNRVEKEAIIYGEIDLEMIIDAKWGSDCIGHYARPDITKLLINEEGYKNYEIMKPFSSDEKKESDFKEMRDDFSILAVEIEKTNDPHLTKLFLDFYRKYNL